MSDLTASREAVIEAALSVWWRSAFDGTRDPRSAGQVGREADDRAIRESGGVVVDAEPPGWIVLTLGKSGDWQPDWDGVFHRDREKADEEYALAAEQLGESMVKLAEVRWVR